MEKIEEQLTDILPPSQRSGAKHRILVTYSSPNHTMVTKRKEKQQTHVRVPATDKRGNSVYKAEAEELAKKHMKKKGYRVHEVTHVGLVNEAKSTSGVYEKAQENKQSADSAKKQGDMFTHHMHMADHHENMSQWHSEEGRHNMADIHAEKAEQHHEKAMHMKEGRDAYQRDEYSSKQGFGRRRREDDEYHTPDPTTRTHKVTFNVSKEGEAKHSRTVTISHSKRSPEEAKSAARAHLEKKGYTIHEETELEEARANTAGARASLAKRKTKVPLTPEEQIAKDRAKIEKWKAKNQKPAKPVSEAVFQSRAKLRLADALRKEREKREAEEERREKKEPEEKSEKNDKD